ncbi:unnamed protein product [Alternaria alternata]
MADEGRQTTPEKHTNDQQQVWPYLSTVAKYDPGNKIQITEIVANKQKRKKLWVAFSRKTPDKKTEYQLTETEGDTTKLYMNGKWFPQDSIKVV